jgi:hypothetical protein
MPFASNVFINCPFDSDYRQFLRPLLFTTIYLGFQPRIALEGQNAAEPRIEKIARLVRESKFGIHDLSRIRAQAAGDLFRLNMPFELGLDVGARRYGAAELQDKRCLIIEVERYRYQAALSDLAGSDIAVYNDDPVELVSEVRNWLAGEANLEAPGAALVWARFNEFMAENYTTLKARGFSDRDVERYPIGELVVAMSAWVRANPAR